MCKSSLLLYLFRFVLFKETPFSPCVVSAFSSLLRLRLVERLTSTLGTFSPCFVL